LPVSKISDDYYKTQEPPAMSIYRISVILNQVKDFDKGFGDAYEAEG
jgi:hypothetical protein